MNFKNRKNPPSTLAQLDAMRQAEINEYVKLGMITPQQAHTVTVMNHFTDALYFFGFVGSPPDKPTKDRIQILTDTWIDNQAYHDAGITPSFLLDETEDLVFAMAGLRCGTENSTEKDTLSAVLITAQRVFVFDHKEDLRIPFHQKAISPPMAAVTQAPLKNIRYIKLNQASPLFPYGSFEFCYQIPELLVQYYRDTLKTALARMPDSDIAKKWRCSMEQFTGLQTYEMEIRDPFALSALLDLLPLLQDLSKQEGFPVINSLGRAGV